MARPTKKNPLGKQKKPKSENPDVIKKLEEAFLMDCTVWEACFSADISQQTYYTLIKEQPKLLERFEACREQPTINARKCLTNAILMDSDLALKYLERKRKLEFSTKQELWITDKDWNDIIPKLTPEQLKNIWEEMLKITWE